ncbi:hypothetical protein [Pseudonocardia kunmingensis]|uniref:hypothetical protein n=1 Tax=Pseudonocardia kunmingensis TaxID=630975 RepID=UPI0011522F0C|nr:hypothetical protein [Pseudonocardia kunmingensis]
MTRPCSAGVDHQDPLWGGRRIGRTPVRPALLLHRLPPPAPQVVGGTGEARRLGRVPAGPLHVGLVVHGERRGPPPPGRGRHRGRRRRAQRPDDVRVGEQDVLLVGFLPVSGVRNRIGEAREQAVLGDVRAGGARTRERVQEASPCRLIAGGVGRAEECRRDVRIFACDLGAEPAATRAGQHRVHLVHRGDGSGDPRLPVVSTSTCGMDRPEWKYQM